MNKWQALQTFWESFGIPAYDENSVPDDAEMPYITYRAAVADFENIVLLSASIWYHSSSWEDISLKADDIAKALSPFRLLHLANGEYVFLCKGSPFAQRMEDENDAIKRIYINLMAEYFSAT